MIEDIGLELAEPIEKISAHENAIAELIQKERRIRVEGEILEGKRVLPQKLQQERDEYGKQISEYCKKIKEIEKENEPKFEQLKKNRREWLRLQGKEKVYETGQGRREKRISGGDTHQGNIKNISDVHKGKCSLRPFKTYNAYTDNAES